MRIASSVVGIAALALVAPVARAQTPPPDPVATLVARLELDRYKATVKA